MFADDGVSEEASVTGGACGNARFVEIGGPCSLGGGEGGRGVCGLAEAGEVAA